MRRSGRRLRLRFTRLHDRPPRGPEVAPGHRQGVAVVRADGEDPVGDPGRNVPAMARAGGWNAHLSAQRRQPRNVAAPVGAPGGHRGETYDQQPRLPASHRAHARTCRRRAGRRSGVGSWRAAFFVAKPAGSGGADAARHYSEDDTGDVAGLVDHGVARERPLLQVGEEAAAVVFGGGSRANRARPEPLPGPLRPNQRLAV